MKAQINIKADPQEIMISLGIADIISDNIKLKNAGVLFFASNPQKFFPESYITCVRYKDNSRFSIIDKKDFDGNLIDQIENSLSFLERHITTGIGVGSQELARHTQIEEYPKIALREALINAVTHRDYIYDNSHIYVHFFSDRIEIENPGGLCHGMSLENLGQRSVRRNRLIADLLHRCGYIERVGSGFSRMEQALKENNNPPFEVGATNFFLLKFYPRIENETILSLTIRQRQIYQTLQKTESSTQSQLSALFNISRDTVLRDINILIDKKLAKKVGIGKATAYKVL